MWNWEKKRKEIGTYKPANKNEVIVEWGKKRKEGTRVIMRIKGKKVTELKRRKKFMRVIECKKKVKVSVCCIKECGRV